MEEILSRLCKDLYNCEDTYWGKEACCNMKRYFNRIIGYMY